MKLNQTTIAVTDVLAVCRTLEQIFAITADYSDEQFAQLTLGHHMIMLTLTQDSSPSSVTLHCQVEDVASQRERLASFGLVMEEPRLTDWGTYSLLIKVSTELTVDCYSLC